MITLVQAEGNKNEQIGKAFGPHVWRAYRNWWVSLLDYYIMLASELTWPQKWAVCNTCYILGVEFYFSRYVVHRSTANRSVRFFW